MHLVISSIFSKLGVFLVKPRCFSLKAMRFVRETMSWSAMNSLLNGYVASSIYAD